MARGNQRDKARERTSRSRPERKARTLLQQSGTEFARTKENVAEIMRAKQAAAEAKKAAEGAKK
ncbi:unnamed protein product [Alternaria alternata]